ncbi:MAG: bifunctional adenosylcobinamide kinase/adenosylcobinamide-phosphate guanylyltransferase [Synergistaceae bacterium]|nr:bifunctional adenosylcobinamide kinase/adenosylcobinamide-phosphate guanylyltransferase [Synergistaceae bacterium]
MKILIFGQAGSGKSHYAEERLSALTGQPKIYAAMSPVVDDEMRQRVMRHRAMRAGRGFVTVEREGDLSGCEEIPAGSSVMIESLTAWTANVMFADGVKCRAEVVREIWGDLVGLLGRVRDVVIVADDVFSGGECEGLTEEYVRALAELAVRIGGIADEVTEVVAGVCVRYKP